MNKISTWLFQERLKNQLFKLLSPTLTLICSLCLPNIYPGSHAEILAPPHHRHYQILLHL